MLICVCVNDVVVEMTGSRVVRATVEVSFVDSSLVYVETTHTRLQAMQLFWQ